MERGMRNSARLVVYAISALLLAGCVTPPQYEARVDDPFKLVDARHNNGKYNALKLALLTTQNTKAAFKYVTETRQVGLQWGSITASNELDPQKMANDITGLLQSEFKEVERVDSVDQAKKVGADLMLVLDLRILVGNHSWAQNSVQMESSLRTVDGAPIDLIKANGTSSVPFPASELNFTAAWQAALDQLKAGLEGSPKLAQFAANSRLGGEDAGVALSGYSPPPEMAAVSSSGKFNFGHYYALVVGNDKYEHVTPLKTAENDARAVAEILRKDYGFRVRLLLNATRAEMLDAFDDYRRNLHESDNLLIYYAGHGYLDTDSDRGYWIPVDADRDRRANWLSNSDIADTVRAVRAIHVLVVADSCYSGTLTRNLSVEMTAMDDLTRLAQKRARTALTSGGLEPVEDAGGGGHSVFAKAFIDALRKNTGIVDMSDLFPGMRREVMLASPQTPRYGDIRQAGHDGGDFIFVRRN